MIIIKKSKSDKYTVQLIITNSTVMIWRMDMIRSKKILSYLTKYSLPLVLVVHTDCTEKPTLQICCLQIKHSSFLSRPCNDCLYNHILRLHSQPMLPRTKIYHFNVFLNSFQMLLWLKLTFSAAFNLILIFYLARSAQKALSFLKSISSDLFFN